MSYHGQAKLEALIDATARLDTDGVSECDTPLPPEVVDRAKRWIGWMLDIALVTDHGWRNPALMERTCDGEFCFLWEHGDNSLYVVVGETVNFFSFQGHPLWGDGTHGDATDSEVMKLIWEEQWLRKETA